MTTIQVFDPAMCCGTGVCGVDINQQLVHFAADVQWVKQQGVNLERFNLAQQPMAFTENSVVKSFLQRAGPDGLPLVLLNGEIALAGRYPSREELKRWTNLQVAQDKPKGGDCCGGKGCCS